MSSYLYEGNYVVCTHHVGTDYRKLQIDKNRRVQSSVLLGSKEKVLLVEIDIVIDEDFKCKTQWNSVVSNTAFGGGIGAGGALAAIAVAGAFIPVAGWVVSAVCVGALALGAIAGALYGYFTNKRKCSNLLGSVGSSWQLPHPTVKFDGQKALTKRSFIQCQEGGQLLPFVSAKVADEAAMTIFWRNGGEMAINGIIAGAGGYAIGTGFGSLIAAAFTVTSFLGSYAIGTMVMPGLINGQNGIIRRKSNYSDADDYYQEMNKSSKKLGEAIENGDFEVDEKYTDASNLGGDQPGAIVNETWSPYNDNSLSNNKKAQKTYDKAIENSKNGVSNSAKNNPGLAEQMKKDEIFNKSGNRRGTLNEKTFKRQSKSYNSRAKWNRAKNTFSIVSMVAPFGGNYLGEMARDVAASYAIKDMDFGTVHSTSW